MTIPFNYSTTLSCMVDTYIPFPIPDTKVSNMTDRGVDLTENDDNKTKSIRVELPLDEYEEFHQLAQRERVTLRHLARTKMLDSPVGLQEYKDHQARLLPSMHSLIDKVDDERLQAALRRKVGEFCAYL